MDVSGVRWAIFGVLASSLAAAACSSGSGAADGGTGIAGSGAAGKSGGSGGTSGATDGGSPDAAQVPPCGALLNCCAIINDLPTGPCNTGGCSYEGACVVDAVSLQESVCTAALGTNGYCRPNSGTAVPAACGTECTRLAGCCGQLAGADAGQLIPGCMALATNCTTGSEANCTNMLQIMTGVTTTAGFAPLSCP